MIPRQAQSALDDLRELAGDDDWLRYAGAAAEEAFARPNHGDWDIWCAALASLPETAGDDPPDPVALDRASPRLGAARHRSGTLRRSLMALHPWRKGPLQIGGVPVDSEWRSDWKWDRLARAVGFSGKRILDVGCGNGYFGWRMLGQGADIVVGADPTWVFVMQWLACRHFAGAAANFVLPLGAEQLPEAPAEFDQVCSMGVIYHRRDPMEHLRQLRSFLRHAGELVLETLVLPDDDPRAVLAPPGRYARMRNVWSVPRSDEAERWLGDAGFRDVSRIDLSATTAGEQRSTPWMQFESLDRALDENDPTRTIEGHPAPRRAMFLARR